MSDSVVKLCSKRIQFHIDGATSLPLPKRSQKAPITYVSVKIADMKDRLKTSVAKGQVNPIWQQNLTPTRINETSEVTFEVKRRSIWPKLSASPLAMTDPYPLSTLLKMQGGNTFGTNIELPLHAVINTTPSVPTIGCLSVNVRELTSIETARLSCEMADRMARDVQKIEGPDGVQHLETAMPEIVSI
ncbi:hypothetical protein DFH07DRAFT_839644 [Mycena maculata]|uniref:C2 domain-containing protein n=1 Tax=Mycena maculata TaxID=230809 RepID=A0AAD7ICI8_9AGAR|nr:hypothetical protein DFH07DRAFT_839644 [Mycena maculata]